MEVEVMVARRSGGGGGGVGLGTVAASAWGRRRRGDGNLVAGARSGGGHRGGGDGGTEACSCGGGGVWTPLPAFREQPLEMEETPFFSQMTARVCGGVPSPLIETKMGREGKGPTGGPQPKTQTYS